MLFIEGHVRENSVVHSSHPGPSCLVLLHNTLWNGSYFTMHLVSASNIPVTPLYCPINPLTPMNHH